MIQVLVKRSEQEDWEVLATCEPEDFLTYRVILSHVQLQHFERVEVVMPSGTRLVPSEFRPKHEPLH